MEEGSMEEEKEGRVYVGGLILTYLPCGEYLVAGTSEAPHDIVMTTNFVS